MPPTSGHGTGTPAHTETPLEICPAWCKAAVSWIEQHVWQHYKQIHKKYAQFKLQKVQVDKAEQSDWLGQKHYHCFLLWSEPSFLVSPWNQEFRVAFTSKCVQARYQCLYRKCPSDKARGRQYKQKLNDFLGQREHNLATVANVFASAQSEINGILEWISRLSIYSHIATWAHKYHSSPLPQNWWSQ